MGILKRAISKDASAVSMALDATDIVNEIEKYTRQVPLLLPHSEDFQLLHL